jgi:hypothetical protein
LFCFSSSSKTTFATFAACVNNRRFVIFFFRGVDFTNFTNQFRPKFSDETQIGSYFSF